MQREDKTVAGWNRDFLRRSQTEDTAAEKRSGSIAHFILTKCARCAMMPTMDALTRENVKAKKRRVYR